MIAIKGTLKNMQCRNCKYEIGKTYKMDERPILGRKGFHACLNPYGVERYGNDNECRFFLVNLGGSITNTVDSYTSIAANEITFIK